MKTVVAAVVIALACASAAVAQSGDKAEAPRPGAVSNFFTSMGRDLVRQTSVDPKEARRKAAGKLVADGKCDEAVKMALDAGDIDLAASLKTLCAKPAETASAAK